MTLANAQHLQWLLEDPTKWNEMRLDPGFTPDLSDANIADELRCANRVDDEGRPELSGTNLSRANFRGADFRRARLSFVNLSGADLRCADFRGARLSYVDLSGAGLRGADISKAYLMHTDLRGGDLTRAKLKGADFEFADIRGTDLTDSRVWDARLFHLFQQLTQIRRDFNHEVGSIDDILREIDKLSQQDFVLYFRGESDDTWDLSPGVMRKSQTGRYALRSVEGEMLVELISRRPEDFAGASSALEQLVIAQHFGLRTRLLDVTSNPLVALFHATNQPSGTGRRNRNVITERNGRVHVFTVPKSIIRPFNSDTVSVIANFAKLRRNEQNLLLGKTMDYTKEQGDDNPGYGADPFISSYQHAGGRYSEAMNRLYQFIRQEKPSFHERIDPRDLFRVFLVQPQHAFERIKAQSGAFLLSAFHERFETVEIREKNPGTPVYGHHVLKVRHQHQAEIHQQLRSINVTHEMLFPGLDADARAITHGIDRKPQIGR